MPLPFEPWRSTIHLPDVSPASVNGLADARVVAGQRVGWSTDASFPIAGGVDVRGKFLDPFGTPFASYKLVGRSQWMEPQFQAATIGAPRTEVLVDGRVLFSWQQALDARDEQPAIRNAVYDPVSHALTTLHTVTQGSAGNGSASLVSHHDADQLASGAVAEAVDIVNGFEQVAPGTFRPQVDVTVAVLGLDGTQVAAVQANTTTTLWQYDPSVAALDTGFVVAWTDESESGGDTSDTAVRARLFGPTATPLTGEILVNTSTEGDQQDVELAALPGGGFVAVWQSRATTGTLGWDIRAQRFDAEGDAVGSELAVNTVTGGEQTAPAVHAFADGSWLVAWIYNHAWVQAQYFDVDGARIGGEFRVGTTARMNSKVHITETSDGRVLVTWDAGSEFAPAADGQFLDNRPALVYGTSDDDVILGHDAGQAAVNDILVSFAGEDTLYGLAGIDYLYAGAGDDLAIAGVGDDVLLGEEGDDTLYGEDGNDYLYGHGGTNVLVGGAGVDVLIAQGDGDTLYGGEGGDSLYAYDAGGALALGEAGNDTFVMQAGPSVAFGGAGQDYFYMGAAADEMHGGEGVDVLIGQASGGETGEGDLFDGGAGTDYLFLTPGEDTVVMNLQSGVDVVNGFDTDNDAVHLQGTALTSFDQVLAATSDYGSFCIVTLDANTAFWLLGLSSSQMHAGMFVFA
ncbi:MAG TPA: calcium-binding protein [Ramlibacter sp.]|jgi:Ca2+-binding RTX toxin-like protein|nr:calcium-binding protein [Ramlibacter sp.]